MYASRLRPFGVLLSSSVDTAKSGLLVLLGAYFVGGAIAATGGAISFALAWFIGKSTSAGLVLIVPGVVFAQLVMVAAGGVVVRRMLSPQPFGFSGAMAEGRALFAASPRILGVGLAVAFGPMLPVGVAFLLFIGLGTAAGTAGAAVGAVGVVTGYCAALYGAVRLLPANILAVCGHEDPLRKAWASTEGMFWTLLGRMIGLYLVFIAAMIPAAIVAVVIAKAAPILLLLIWPAAALAMTLFSIAVLLNTVTDLTASATAPTRPTGPAF